MSLHNVIIIGSGPAAYTAGIYTARANLNPVIFEGNLPGGQLITTTMVENYPGFSDGIDGYELMQEMQKQCVNVGCKIYSEYVTKVELSNYPYSVVTETGTVFHTKSIIIATGANAKKLKLPNGDKYWNKGISACATCDGALPFFRRRPRPLAVVGGGDTACEESMHLSKFGSIVYMLVRGDKMRASKAMQKKVTTNEKIKIIYNTQVLNVGGNEFLESIQVVDANGVESEIKVNGLFYGIGHEPNTAFLENQIELNESKYIKAVNTKTNKAGVFAAGDVQDYIYRQAITAAGSGCMAAIECEKYLESLE
jgi:thioredoxin reductase (NADPH)